MIQRGSVIPDNGHTTQLRPILCTKSQPSVIAVNCAIVVLYEISLVSAITTMRISIWGETEAKHYPHAICKEDFEMAHNKSGESWNFLTLKETVCLPAFKISAWRLLFGHMAHPWSELSLQFALYRLWLEGFNANARRIEGANLGMESCRLEGKRDGWFSPLAEGVIGQPQEGNASQWFSVYSTLFHLVA